jgi:regulator of replication initiation timing
MPDFEEKLAKIKKNLAEIFTEIIDFQLHNTDYEKRINNKYYNKLVGKASKMAAEIEYLKKQKQKSNV